MSKVVWTESATADLGRHYDYLKLNNPDAAAKAVQAIVQSGESLEQNPRRGAIVDEVATPQTPRFLRQIRLCDPLCDS